jgi:uncharacterized protein (TIGR02001 family)
MFSPCRNAKSGMKLLADTRPCCVRVDREPGFEGFPCAGVTWGLHRLQFKSIEPKKGQGQMKKSVLSVVAALAVAGSASPVFAADVAVKGPAAPPPPPAYMLDVAVGGVVMSDYLFRGISQSNKAPSGGAYFEPDLTTPIGTFYAGIAGYAISWPSAFPYGFTDPSAEIDIYGGWRNSWGPLSLDLGIIEYYYPGESWNGVTKTSDFYEIYGKVGYDFGNGFSIGGNIFYTPDLLHYSVAFRNLGLTVGKPDAIYYSGTAAYEFPKWGDLTTSISGELGYWDIATSGFILAGGTANPSYTYWNVGIAFGYKDLTLDLRYHGTDQSVQDCANFLVVAVPNGSNSWCDDEFVASLKFDTSVAVGH